MADDRLCKIRGGHRAVTTKIICDVDEMLAGEGLLEAEQLKQLSVKMQQLDGKLKVLSDIDKEILDKCEMDTIEREVDESEAISAKILQCKQRISDAITLVAAPPPAAAATEAVSSGPSSKPKLPKLTLPRFRGDLTSWTTFWGLYKSIVHEYCEITKVDKFSYLKSLLEGAAAKAIQGLALSDANYDSAVDLFRERFSKSQANITAHMEELLKVPGCTSDRSHFLRSVYNKIIIHIRGLESLEVTSDQYGSLLILIILSKFPSDIRLRVVRESGDDTWNIDELLKIIRLEVEAREAKEGNHVSMQKLPTHNVRSQSNPNSTASLLVTRGNSSIHCAYCNGNHFSASCTKVVTQGERRESLKKSGRCFNCLCSGHRSKNCNSPKNCCYCHHRHHQSLCEHCPTLKREASLPEKNLEPKSVTTNTSNQTNHKQVVLLQTAQVEAVGEYDVIPVRILLDNGSQLSYITVSLKSRLKFKSVRQERLSLNKFGSDSFKTKGCDLVRVTLQKSGSNEGLEIMARTPPVICSSLPALVSVNKYSHL